jgi:hypothetical protein
MPSLDELLTAIRRQNEACLDQPLPDVTPCASRAEALESCGIPAARGEAEALISFRRPLPLAPVEFQAPQPPAPPKIPLSCVPIELEGIRVTLALDLLLDQSWHFQDLLIDRLAGTVALAPAEVLRVTVRSTQRKVLNRSSIDEVEQTDSTEATIVDRDVINVTRSSSKTDNWEASGEGSVSIPIYGATVDFGGSGGMSGSATRTVGATSEQVTEATRKSASNLRTLRKIEVTETTETFEERDRSRRIVNPYRDRSLLLKVFSIAKDYCVQIALSATRPVLILEITDMVFDRDFVIANAAFLDTYLIDRRLALELPEALEAVTDPSPVSTSAEIDRLAALALSYLFDVPNLFNVGNIDGTDANAPDSSFDAGLSNSALADTVRTNLGIVFTTLNYFFHLYRNEAGGDPRLATQIALAIEDALNPRWPGIEEANTVSDVIDTNDRTEAFRRLAGFLAFVSGTIRPLVRPAEEEKVRVEASRRAEFVVMRTIEHLGCHQKYYIARYLEHLAGLTRGVSLVDFVEQTLAQIPAMPGSPDDVSRLFAVELAFVDRNAIVVPGRCVYPPDASREFARRIDGNQAVDLPFGPLRTERVPVATEGAYLEPVAGRCVLDDVPQPSGDHRVLLETAEGPVDVRVINESS